MTLTVSCIAEVDFAAELSTLTALSVLRLDVIPMDKSIPESTRLPLPTASLRYLSLQKDRDNTYPRETHGLSRLTGASHSLLLNRMAEVSRPTHGL